jgi:hypothetical protein
MSDKKEIKEREMSIDKIQGNIKNYEYYVKHPVELIFNKTAKGIAIGLMAGALVTIGGGFLFEPLADNWRIILAGGCTLGFIIGGGYGIKKKNFAKKTYAESELQLHIAKEQIAQVTGLTEEVAALRQTVLELNTHGYSCENPDKKQVLHTEQPDTIETKLCVGFPAFKPVNTDEEYREGINAFTAATLNENLIAVKEEVTYHNGRCSYNFSRLDPESEEKVKSQAKITLRFAADAALSDDLYVPELGIGDKPKTRKRVRENNHRTITEN